MSDLFSELAFVRGGARREDRVAKGERGRKVSRNRNRDEEGSPLNRCDASAVGEGAQHPTREREELGGGVRFSLVTKAGGLQPRGNSYGY